MAFWVKEEVMQYLVKCLLNLILPPAASHIISRLFNWLKCRSKGIKSLKLTCSTILTLIREDRSNFSYLFKLSDPDKYVFASSEQLQIWKRIQTDATIDVCSVSSESMFI